MNRQTERRKLFELAFAQMPAWETWTTTNQPEIQPSQHENMVSMYDLRDVFPSEPSEPPKVQHHVRTIPRRVRRSMARDLAKRRWEIR